MASGRAHPSTATATATGSRGRVPATRLAGAAVAGAAALLLLALSTLLTVAFTDYEEEALPAVNALVGGHPGAFLDRLPAYGGSLILRAPAALLAHAAGGGELAVFRALALPCLLAALAFALVLFAHLSRRRAPVAAWIALGVVVLNPVLLPALDTGHPEEILGAALCAGGVLAALRDRPLLAGVLLGVAGANKAWAVLAVVPALVACRGARARLTLTGAAGLVCLTVLAPALLHGTGAVQQARTAAHGAGAIFQPWQWSWYLGHHGAVVRGVYGVKPGFRTGPGWLATLGHLPVVAVPVALSLLAWGRRVPREDALLLLALAFLLRCVVDPWDTAYYHLPFLFALAAHEVLTRHRAPLCALLAGLAVYGACVMARDSATPDVQALLYLAWSVPATVACALAIFAPRRWQALSTAGARRLSDRLPSLARMLGPAPAPAPAPAPVSRRP